jgi:hypothetical protein
MTDEVMGKPELREAEHLVKHLLVCEEKDCPSCKRDTARLREVISRHEIRALNDVLPVGVKFAIADEISIESRSKSDVVQDVWDELVSRGLVREPRVESSAIGAKALFKNVCDFVKRWGGRVPESSAPKSLEIISDFYLCMGSEPRFRLKETEGGGSK